MMKSNKNYLNKLIFKRSFKNIFSFTFILCLISETAYPSIYALNSKKISTNSNGSPLAKSAGEMVDLYTGDFHYSVPLLNVPGPNGENVSISASYQGAVRMNQKASWLGLGWDYNPGEITRQVVGYPDDYNGIPIYNSSNSFLAYPSTNFDFKKNFAFGSLYFNNYNNTNLFLGQYPLVNAITDSASNLVSNFIDKSLDLYTSETFQNPNNVTQYSTGQVSAKANGQNLIS